MTPSALKVTFIALALLNPTSAFPSYASGRAAPSPRQLDDTTRSFKEVVPPPPPGPLAYDGPKLVDDAEHPYMPPRPGDARGPCPGLNTLANHGYLPRDGVATPAQIITACMEGFNFANTAARTAAYFGHLLNGNQVTNLLSIGQKTPNTGPDTPGPAFIGGLNMHGTFEGDASLTREDAFFGNNHDVNVPLFLQFKQFSERYGGGYYNYTVAAELRRHRIAQSIARNPEFDMVGLRHATLYGEAALAANLFIDGRITETTPLPSTGQKPHHLDMASAESIFVHGRFPRGFWRQAKPVSAEGADQIFAAYPTVPGRNVAGVNTFKEDQSRGNATSPCALYHGAVSYSLKNQYPNPTGVVLRNLKINLQYLHDAFVDSGLANCEQPLPYGK